jgi:hypothetical protein
MYLPPMPPWRKVGTQLFSMKGCPATEQAL